MFDPMKINETDTYGNLKRAHAGEVNHLKVRIGRWKDAAYLGWAVIVGFILRDVLKSAGWL